MIKIFTILGLLTFLINSCGHSTDDAELIDYQELNEIEVKLALEIGESDKYVPSYMGQMFLASDGTMLVSDGQVTIEQFDEKGVHMGTVAKEGRGPGELSSLFFSLIDGGNDTLMVRDHNKMQIMFFFPGKKEGKYIHIKSTVLERNHLITTIGPHSETDYYAIIGDDVRDKFDSYSYSKVVIVDASDKILQDSLQTLKTPNSYSEKNPGSGMTYFGVPPYQYHDRFRLLEDSRYLIARPDSASLFVYNRDHELEKQITLKVKEHPVQGIDLDYEFNELRDVSLSVRRGMETRVPDVKPPFLNIWMSENHFWLHTDNSEEGKHFVVFTMKGEPLGKFRLPVDDIIQYFKDDRIYSLHKNPETGHSIRVYQVGLLCCDS